MVMTVYALFLITRSLLVVALHLAKTKSLLGVGSESSVGVAYKHEEDVSDLHYVPKQV